MACQPHSLGGGGGGGAGRGTGTQPRTDTEREGCQSFLLFVPTVFSDRLKQKYVKQSKLY